MIKQKGSGFKESNKQTDRIGKKKENEAKTSRSINNLTDLKPIPHPELNHWMFRRIAIPDKFPITREFWERSNKQFAKSNIFFSRLIKYTRAFKHPHFVFIIITRFFLLYFKLFNRIEIKGKNNVPKSGAIFYVNHPGSFDTMILSAAFGKPISCFIAWENVLLTKFAEKSFGYVNKYFIRKSRNFEQYGSFRDILIEKMIRTILEKNRFFAIWPSGGLDDDVLVRRGFSSIVRAYAALNSKKNIIPFVPVLIKNSQCYHINKNPKLRPRFDKISIEFLDPIFIPREWLENPSENPSGKTPREIIDYLMMILAKANGQKRLARNRGLEWRKKKYLEETKKRERNEKKEKNEKKS